MAKEQSARVQVGMTCRVVRSTLFSVNAFADHGSISSDGQNGKGTASLPGVALIDNVDRRLMYCVRKFEMEAS
jgi:hypothetical protein